MIDACAHRLQLVDASSAFQRKRLRILCELYGAASKATRAHLTCWLFWTGHISTTASPSPHKPSKFAASTALCQHTISAVRHFLCDSTKFFYESFWCYQTNSENYGACVWTAFLLWLTNIFRLWRNRKCATSRFNATATWTGIQDDQNLCRKPSLVIFTLLTKHIIHLSAAVIPRIYLFKKFALFMTQNYQNKVGDFIKR